MECAYRYLLSSGVGGGEAAGGGGDVYVVQCRQGIMTAVSICSSIDPCPCAAVAWWLGWVLICTFRCFHPSFLPSMYGVFNAVTDNYLTQLYVRMICGRK